METPIKHRITGAIILVALVVVLVPEMLSGPRPPAAAVPIDSITLPTSGTASTAPLRSIDIDVAERARGRASLPASTSGPQASAGEAMGLPASAGMAVAPPPSAAAPSAAAPPAPAPPAGAPARAAPVAAARPAGIHVVQVGSFASRTTADALSATLRRQGFAATVSVVQADGRTLHRVRVGPAGERADADALRARLRKAGHSGTVVAGP